MVVGRRKILESKSSEYLKRLEFKEAGCGEVWSCETVEYICCAGL
jgi:hypothetical protein